MEHRILKTESRSGKVEGEKDRYRSVLINWISKHRLNPAASHSICK